MTQTIKELTKYELKNPTKLVEVLTEWYNEDKFESFQCKRIRTALLEYLQSVRLTQLTDLYDDWEKGKDNETDKFQFVKNFFFNQLNDIVIEKRKEEEVNIELNQLRYPFIGHKHGSEYIKNHIDNTEECFLYRKIIIFIRLKFKMYFKITNMFNSSELNL